MSLKYIKKDADQFYKNMNVFIKIVLLLANPCFMSIFFYRIAHFLYHLRLGIISKLIMLLVRIIYNIEIGYKAKIGAGFRIAHGSGTVIGEKCIIGDNVMIGQNVTLGSNFEKQVYYNGKLIDQPVIKDNCFIMAGAKIVGPVIIEENCIIGVNSVLTKSTQKNGVYAGIPARRIKETNEVRSKK